jgi:hypothetical protein
VVAGHDTDLRLLLAFVGLNSDSERAPSPRKTCPSVVLRVLGKFPPIGARLSLPERAHKGLVVGAINIRRAEPTPARDTPIPEQCFLEQFLIVFWQTKPSFLL